MAIPHRLIASKVGKVGKVGYTWTMSTSDQKFTTIASTTVDSRRRVVLGKTTAQPGDTYLIQQHPDGRIQLVPTKQIHVQEDR